jgi:ADP-ribosylglycohydrolase
MATCSAIINAHHVDPANIASEFAYWHRRRRFTGLGSSTLKALTELAAGQHWALAGAKGERAAGNGAAMRIAPLAFCLYPFDDDARRLIRDVCRITHHHDEAYVGALAICQAIGTVAMDRVPLEGVLICAERWLPDCRVRDRLRELIALEQCLSIAEVAQKFGNSGYVVDSVPFAIYAAAAAGGPESAAVAPAGIEQTLQEVALAGGDADTNTSLAGQIIGAAFNEIPTAQPWLKQIPGLEDYVDTIEEFASFVFLS